MSAVGSNLDRATDWVRFGVIVASKGGLNGDKALQYAYADGLRLEKLLRVLGQMDSNHITLLRTESATDMRKQLETIGNQIAAQRGQGRKVMLQFYYTGHGGGRNFHIGGEQVGFGEVKDLLEKGKPEARVYVLDVCQGASFFASKGFNTTKPVRVTIDLDKATKGEVTISSSAGEEQAYEVKTLGGSIFTSHWEMALRGAGDRNHDGQVTLFEAYNYAYDQTVAFSRETLNLPQHPSFSIDLTGAKDLLLTRPGSEQGGLLFQNCPVGVYSLLDVKRGTPVGEMRIPESGDYSLALEPGAYRIDHAPLQGPVLSAQVEVMGTSLIPLRGEQFTVRPRGFALGKGNGGEMLDNAIQGDGGNRNPLYYHPSLASNGWQWVSWGGIQSPEYGFPANAFMPEAQVAEMYGLAGAYKPASAAMGFGFQTLKPGNMRFLGGFHFSLQRSHVEYAARGHEPFPEITLNGSPAVDLENTIEITSLQFGPMMAIPIAYWHHFLLSADLSLGALFQNMEIKNQLNSKAYGISVFNQSLSGWGYSLEGHIVPALHFRVTGLPESLLLGLRLGGGYHHVDQVEGDHDSIKLNGSWIGQISLQLSICGDRP